MLQSPIRLRRALLLSLALAVTAGVGCGPRYARVAVADGADLRVELRSQKGPGGAVDRGFDHPVTISAVRVANILSRVDVRKPDRKGPGERRPAIPVETLQPIAEAVSKALARANPSQEVVVRSVKESRRLGIFSDRKFTGLVVWAEGDQLMVHVTHVDRMLQKSQNDKLPEPWADEPQDKLRVLAGPAMVLTGSNGLAVDWRNPLFRRAGNVRIGGDGRLRRRTILLEETGEEAAAAERPAVSLPALSPEALRELADLEELRREGGISEADYQRRRRELLGAAPPP